MVSVHFPRVVFIAGPSAGGVGLACGDEQSGSGLRVAGDEFAQGGQIVKDGRPRPVECGVGMDRVVDIARPTAELVTQVCDVDAEPVATHQ